jgi:hypothetical protein
MVFYGVATGAPDVDRLTVTLTDGAAASPAETIGMFPPIDAVLSESVNDAPDAA